MQPRWSNRTDTNRSRRRALDEMSITSRSSRQLMLLTMDLTAAPDLPFGFKHIKSTTTAADDEHDDDTSCSSWYIPGITEKARCLRIDGVTHTPRRTKTDARQLYCPTPNPSNESSLSSLNYSHPKLHLDMNGTVPDYLPCDVADRGGSMSSIESSSLHDSGTTTTSGMDHDSPRNHTTSNNGRTCKLLLQSHLGSLRSLLEEHQSIKELEKFKASQITTTKHESNRRKKGTRKSSH